MATIGKYSRQRLFNILKKCLQDPSDCAQVTFGDTPPVDLNVTFEMDVNKTLQVYCPEDRSTSIAGAYKIDDGGKLVINEGVVATLPVNCIDLPCLDPDDPDCRQETGEVRLNPADGLQTPAGHSTIPPVMSVSIKPEDFAGTGITTETGGDGFKDLAFDLNELPTDSNAPVLADYIAIYDVSESKNKKITITALNTIIEGEGGSGGASTAAPYLVWEADTTGLSNEKILSALSSFGLSVNTSTSGTFKMGIDVTNATDGSNLTIDKDNDLILLYDANTTNLCKIPVSKFGVGDVMAGSREAGSGENFNVTNESNRIMVSHGTIKTIKYPDSTIDTYGQALQVQGNLKISDSSGTDTMVIYPDYRGTSTDDHATTIGFKEDAVFRIGIGDTPGSGTDLMRLESAGDVRILTGVKFQFEQVDGTQVGFMRGLAADSQIAGSEVANTGGSARFGDGVLQLSVDQDGASLYINSLAENVEALWIRANADSTSTGIKIQNDSGTGTNAIKVISESGGITLDAAVTKGITISSKSYTSSQISGMADTNALYNNGGALYWENSKITLGAANVDGSAMSTAAAIAVLDRVDGTTDTRYITEVSGFTHDGTTFTATATNVDIVSNSIDFGADGDSNVVTTYKGNTNDGVITWAEDENYFQYYNDILLYSDKTLFFRGSSTFIKSTDDSPLILNITSNATGSASGTTDKINVQATSIEFNVQSSRNVLDVSSEKAVDSSGNVFPSYFASSGHSGDIIKLLNTSSLSASKMYFLDHNGGSPQWVITDATDNTKGAKEFLAIALSTTSGAGMLTRGYFHLTDDYWEGTPSVGDPLYMSETEGLFHFTAPSGANKIVRVVGYCVAYETQTSGDPHLLIYFNPSTDWIERAS